MVHGLSSCTAVFDINRSDHNQCSLQHACHCADLPMTLASMSHLTLHTSCPLQSSYSLASCPAQLHAKVLAGLSFCRNTHEHTTCMLAHRFWEQHRRWCAQALCVRAGSAVAKIVHCLLSGQTHPGAVAASTSLFLSNRSLGIILCYTLWACLSNWVSPGGSRCILHIVKRHSALRHGR